MNIDDLTISKSSKSNFWPILISIVNIPELKNLIFPIGIFHSTTKKPYSIDDFLNIFIKEIKIILAKGLLIQNRIIQFSVTQIVCDAPAKAYILNVKNHNAYFSCNTCGEEGIFLNGSVSYLGIKASRRTDYSFCKKLNTNYHRGDSPLEQLPIDMINNLPSDYMHMVCLGVMKRLIGYLHDLRTFYPSDFSRLPRPIED